MLGSALAAKAATAATIAAAKAPSGPNFNTNGIIAWVVQAILPILLLVLGVRFISGAKKGRMSDTANTTAHVIVGLIFIFGGAALVVFGQGLVKLIFA